MNRRLLVLGAARGLDFWCRPKGSQPLGTRMIADSKIKDFHFMAVILGSGQKEMRESAPIQKNYAWVITDWKYLSDLIRIQQPLLHNLRRNDNGCLLERPNAKTKKTMGDRAFQIAAPFLWNRLPRSAPVFSLVPIQQVRYIFKPAKK